MDFDRDFADIAPRYDAGMRWLVDGYNVIRRSPDLLARERESLERGRDALCRLLARAARAPSEGFTVVFDGARGGGRSSAGAGVTVLFSSARETADGVLARLAGPGSAVVSSDREVRRAAAAAGAIAITADEFLSRLARLGPPSAPAVVEPDWPGKEEEEEGPRGPKKGNPRRLGKKARARARALGRLGPPRGSGTG